MGEGVIGKECAPPAFEAMVCAIRHSHDHIFVGSNDPTFRAMSFMHAEVVSVLEKSRHARWNWCCCGCGCRHRCSGGRCTCRRRCGGDRDAGIGDPCGAHPAAPHGRISGQVCPWSHYKAFVLRENVVVGKQPITNTAFVQPELLTAASHGLEHGCAICINTLFLVRSLEILLGTISVHIDLQTIRHRWKSGCCGGGGGWDAARAVACADLAITSEAAFASTNVRTKGIGADRVRGARVCSLQTLIDLHASLAIAIIPRVALAIVGANGVDAVCIGMTPVAAIAFVDVGAINSIARETGVASTSVRAGGIDTMSVGMAKSGTGDGALVDVSARFAVAIEARVACARV